MLRRLKRRLKLGVSSTEDTEIDGDLPGGSIRNQHWNGERVHPVGASSAQVHVLVVHRCETTNARADHYATLFGSMPVVTGAAMAQA